MPAALLATADVKISLSMPAGARRLQVKMLADGAPMPKGITPGCADGLNMESIKCSALDLEGSFNTDLRKPRQRAQRRQTPHPGSLRGSALTAMHQLLMLT
jgi:hypothetical protein